MLLFIRKVSHVRAHTFEKKHRKRLEFLYMMIKYDQMNESWQMNRVSNKLSVKVRKG